MVLGGACARRSGDLGPPPTVFSPIGSSPSPAATASSSASSSLDPGASSTSTPTSPLIATVTAGNASATVTGGINSSLALPTLSPPGVWTLPPAEMSLNWIDAAGQSGWLAGPSFTSRLATSSADTLSMTIRASDGSFELFKSSSGECFVSISTALPDRMDGIFDCENLASVDGKLTVSAQGTFMASR
jgi:hypothetical protein